MPIRTDAAYARELDAQDELAATIGATREAVAKALRLLRTQNIVRTGNRMVEILDPALLALLADGHQE